MPEVDHGSAAAKYFLTGSPAVRVGVLMLAGPNSPISNGESFRLEFQPRFEDIGNRMK